MNEQEQRQITQAFTDALNNSRGSTIPGGGVGGGGINTSAFGATFDAFTGGVGQAGEAAIGFAGKLVAGTATVPDISRTVTNMATPLFGKMAGVFGNASTSVLQFVDDSVKNWQDFSKMGVTLGGSFIDLNRILAQTQTDYNTLHNVFTEMGGQQLAFGKSMSESATLFGNFSQSLKENADVNEKLNRLGIRSDKERTELIATMLRSYTGLNLSSADATAQVIKNLGTFAEELTKTAEMGGASRKQALDNAKEIDSNLMLLGAKIMKIREGDLKFSDIAEQVKTSTSGFNSKELIDAVVQATANNGRIQDTGKNKTLTDMMMMAPETFAKASRLGATAGDKTKSGAERDEATEQMKNLQKDFIAEFLTKTGPTFIRNGQLTESQNAIVQQNRGLIDNFLNRQVQLSLEQGVKPDQVPVQDVIREMENAGAFASKGASTSPTDPRTGTKPGQANEGAEATVAYLNAQDRLKDVTNLSVTAVEGFLKQMGATNGVLETMNNNPLFRSSLIFNAAVSNLLGQKEGGKTLTPEGMTSILEKLMNEIRGPKKEEPKKNGAGGTGGGVIGDLGFEYTEDESNQRVYNNGQTKTLLAGVQDGMRTFPILSNQLQRNVDNIKEAVVSAMASTSSNSTSDDGQNPLLEEIKKLNTNVITMAGFNKAMVDGINKTVRAIESADSVYG